MTRSSTHKTPSLFEEDKKNTSTEDVVSVLLPVPLEKTYDYLIEGGLPVGSYVKVPFGKRSLISVTWDRQVDEKTDKNLPLHKLKPVEETYDLPPMPEKHRRFLEWVSDYTMAPLGSVLKLSLSTSAAFEKPKKIPAYALNKNKADYADVKITAARQKVLDYLHHQNKAIPSKTLMNEAGVSRAIIKKMAELKMLKVYSIEPEVIIPKERPPVKKDLTEDQKKAVRFIERQQQEDSSVTLIDGVTGSGKTEVYFELIEKSLERKEQVLVLLPEIALTQQIVSRFTERFGFEPTLWHSGLTPAQRRDNWRQVVQGKAKVVVGARSALFLPYPNLKLIIIDEEHDGSYKQEEGVLYHARDMAVVRAKVTNAHIVLASATPSLETVQNVYDGKYESVTLKSRYGGASMPDIHLVDLKRDKPAKDHWISPTLAHAMKETFEKKEQSLLFLNRRGYAPLTICHSCGHRMQCPNCDAWLVEHKRYHRMQCHHCGFVVPTPDSCSECGSVDSLHACGPGVERIVDEVRELLPLAKVAVLSSDNMNAPDILQNTLYQIQKGKVDVIVGTQMLAKGHHFPRLTTVGIVDADLGMNGGDLRASERTYQLLHQVSGRAGREALKGHVYIQSFLVESKVIKALLSGKREDFIEAELSERYAAEMPPFNRLVGIVLSGEDQKEVEDFAKFLAQYAPITEEILTLGPAPAPISFLRGRFRYRFLMRAPKTVHIQKTIDHWLSQVKKPSNIKIRVDIDPLSFL